MTLRPLPARWFELLTARDDLTGALEALARTDSVELETHSDTTTPLSIADLRDRFDEYNTLARRYRPYWPPTTLQPGGAPGGRPSRIMDRALTHLEAWRSEADPIIAELEQLRAEQDDLTLLDEWLEHFPFELLDLDLLAGSGPVLAAGLYVLPPAAVLTHVPPAVISLATPTRAHRFLLLVGPAEELTALGTELGLLKARLIKLPTWLQGPREACRSQLATRLAAITRQSAHDEAALATLARQHELNRALGDIARLEWFLTHVSALPVSENFAWVTGWTSDIDGQALNSALQRNRIRGVLRFPPAPPDKSPPMVLHNPGWARPFEIFARLLGTPARDEIDPSRLLVVIVPLMFGYMFGDVGQGAVLLLAGLFLRRRYPVLGLLIANGLAAIVFGVLFGSVFAREDLIAPVWIHPLSDPLLILGVPLVAGAALLMFGLLLNGIEAYWRRATADWLRIQAPVLCIYLGLLLLLRLPAGALLSLFGLAWYLTGYLWQERARGLRALPAAFGLLLEDMLQLLMNTISFARVGAFALAHAGLSTAVLALAAGSHPLVHGLILVLGNILIIALEGLVVSIQTTRLVLFEFFIRFLRGEGRIFRPLPAPSHPHETHPHETGHPTSAEPPSDPMTNHPDGLPPGQTAEPPSDFTQRRSP